LRACSQPGPLSRFIFFAGKGGVGKTTCAAARAVWEARAGRRVLLVSTDPAHSLGDALGVRLTSRISPVPLTNGRLSAVELDAPRALARWLTLNGRALGDVIEHGTWLDRVDVDTLLGLPVPGIDQLVALLEIANLGREWRLVIVDTAPTGHTLRLLAGPQVVASIAEALATLQRDHRLVRERLTWAERPDAADRLIDLLAAQAEQSGALLRDSHRTSVNWVLLPEELSVSESQDGLAALRRARITVAGLIVNRVTPPGPPCQVCDRRRSDHARVIVKLPRRLGNGMSIHLVPEETCEPRGVAALARLAAALSARKRATFTVHRSPLAARRMVKGALRTLEAERHSMIGARSTVNVLNVLHILHVLHGARLVFFAGKGGVGKTTCAAATAIRMAIAEPHRRVLLLSTDPAHSLADLFGARVTGLHVPPGSPPNLRVKEIDAAAILDQRRDRLERALAEIAETFAPKLDGVSVEQGVRELIALAPPGLDELLAMLSVIEVQDTDDRLVVDMAPTGHALRLLEMPDVAREWVQALMRMLLKYRSLVRPAKLGAELVELSRSIRRLQELLGDSRAARFIVITRAAEMSRLETERLVARLRGLRLSVPAVIVNAMTLSPTGCRRCRAIARSEHAQLARLMRRRKARECAIILTPLVAPPPRGARALDRWARSWIAAEKAPSYMKSLATRIED